jgi:hypothetical protein
MQCDVTPESQNSGARRYAVARQRLSKHIPAATNTHKSLGGTQGVR